MPVWAESYNVFVIRVVVRGMVWACGLGIFRKRRDRLRNRRRATDAGRFVGPNTMIKGGENE